MNLPDLAELIALRGAAQSLSLHSHGAALAQLQGGHRSAQRGRGLEFEEVRLYAAGDDARNIDWRVTARRGKMHTKLFREERERPVWLVVDLHAGLFFGSTCQLKSALMVRAAALLAWVAARGGDRVGAIITDGTATPRIFQPRSRGAGVLPIIEFLIETQPQALGTPHTGGLFNALLSLRSLLQPGSQVVLLSDFGGMDQAVEDLLANLAVRSDCRLMWITDPLESKGLPNGSHYLGVPGNVWHMDGAQSRAAWVRVWHEREQQLRNLASRHNFPLNRLETLKPVQEQLNLLLKEPKWAA